MGGAGHLEGRAPAAPSLSLPLVAPLLDAGTNLKFHSKNAKYKLTE